MVYYVVYYIVYYMVYYIVYNMVYCLSATAIAADPSCYTYCASLVTVNSVGLPEWRLKIGYGRIGGLDAWRIGVARELPGADSEHEDLRPNTYNT